MPNVAMLLETRTIEIWPTGVVVIVVVVVGADEVAKCCVVGKSLLSTRCHDPAICDYVCAFGGS